MKVSLSKLGNKLRHALSGDIIVERRTIHSKTSEYLLTFQYFSLLLSMMFGVDAFARYVIVFTITCLVFQALCA